MLLKVRFLRKPHLRLKALIQRVGHSEVSEVDVHRQDKEEGQKSVGHVKTSPQKRRAVARKESTETP